ncbi:hypothetical protein ENSA5_38520 [Enhygromyxa salina]|uniref:Uncharacterized protein n=2 Tax=Enhygromyxa salina TaxID=215803 RepID=A0A2S9XRK9_9BACT|nr:hypothetical protein ENSA5_38520 [Enhygromyxa salina]
MATHSIVHFEPVDANLDELLASVGRGLAHLDHEVDAIGPLGYDTECGDFGFEGRLEECACFDEAGKKGADWGAIAVRIAPPEPGDYVYSYFWRVESATCIGLEIPSGAIWFENDDWPKVAWLRSFLPSFVSATSTRASAYDNTRTEMFGALDVPTMLDRLKNGDLLNSAPISHYTIQTNLIPMTKIQSTVNEHALPRMNFSVSTTGYYVLDNLH